jgi:hypothetical protein
VFTTKSYPDDMDTTSLGILNIKHDEALVQAVMDEMLAYRDEDGIIMVRIHVDYQICHLTKCHDRRFSRTRDQESTPSLPPAS